MSLTVMRARWDSVAAVSHPEQRPVICGTSSHPAAHGQGVELESEDGGGGGAAAGHSSRRATSLCRPPRGRGLRRRQLRRIPPIGEFGGFARHRVRTRGHGARASAALDRCCYGFLVGEGRRCRPEAAVSLAFTFIGFISLACPVGCRCLKVRRFM